jgi:hypothetical protein
LFPQKINKKIKMSSIDQSNKKRKILTWGEKKQLCEFCERNPSFTYKELGRKFEVAENTVCNILKDKNKWLSTNSDDANKQKYKTPKYPELESSLMIWFNQALSNKRVITGDVILAKAKRFAELLDINDFKGSDGWVSNFKKRNGIKQYNLHGEASSAPSEEIISEERRKLQEILSEFPLEDVYNCDETGKKYSNIIIVFIKFTKYFIY